ncbi:Putative fumarate reductase, partial [Durusdinium trenchii]
HRRKLIQARVMVVEFLEQNGFKQIDVNCKKTNSLGLSRTYPLHEATKQNNPIMVYWLVYLGADPSQKDAAGRHNRILMAIMQNPTNAFLDGHKWNGSRCSQHLAARPASS